MKNDIIKGIFSGLIAILICVAIGTAIGFACSGGEHKEIKPPEGLEETEGDANAAAH